MREPGKQNVSLIRLLGLGRGAAALPASLVRAQLKAARAPYPMTFVCTVLVGALVSFTAPRPDLVWLPTLMLLTVSIWSLVRWYAQRDSDWLVTDSRDTVVTLSTLSFITAASWGLMLYAALIDNDQDGRILLTCAITGVMSVGALTVATLPLASVAFLCGAIVVVVPTVQLVHLPVSVFGLLCIFFALLARSILAQARLFIAHYYAGEELVEAERERHSAEEAARHACPTSTACVSRRRTAGGCCVRPIRRPSWSHARRRARLRGLKNSRRLWSSSWRLAGLPLRIFPGATLGIEGGRLFFF